MAIDVARRKFIVALGEQQCGRSLQGAARRRRHGILEYCLWVYPTLITNEPAASADPARGNGLRRRSHSRRSQRGELHPRRLPLSPALPPQPLTAPPSAPSPPPARGSRRDR